MRTIHPELHRTERIGWLRAAVLGANDGLVSNLALVMGIGATGVSTPIILATGIGKFIADHLTPLASSLAGLLLMSIICSLPVLSPRSP